MPAFAAKTAKKAEPPPAAPAPSLADEIRRGVAAAEQFIESEVDRIKAGEGKDLPREAIKQMLTKGWNCPCATALHILGEGQ